MSPLSPLFPLSPLSLLSFFLCLGAIGFYCYAIYAAIAFSRNSQSIAVDFHPSITILKPICGLDDDSYDNFASFCQQDYPEYQIVFAVRDSQDPCIEVVKQISKDFPEVDIELVINDRIIGNNLKICNLANAQTKAKYPILVLADSDVRVTRDYLKQLIQPMKDPLVGVVTCLYRPLTQGWIANFEAIGVSTEYLAGVLVARQLQGINFALGPTIAIRQTVLEAIGGFDAIADYLADDFQLGYKPTQIGYQVILSDYIIDHAIATHSWLDLINRQIRWYLCTRVSRPWGYLGLILTQGTATSLIYLLVTGGSHLGWIILLITWSLRLIMAWVVGVRVLQDSVAQKFLWIVPLRDLISFGLWCYCIIGNTFQWRGQKLKLTQDGKLVVF